jgi:hypothetical protein
VRLHLKEGESAEAERAARAAMKYDSARAAYQRFLDIWKDANADIPEVIAARERLGQARSV